MKNDPACADKNCFYRAEIEAGFYIDIHKIEKLKRASAAALEILALHPYRYKKVIEDLKEAIYIYERPRRLSKGS